MVQGIVATVKGRILGVGDFGGTVTIIVGGILGVVVGGIKSLSNTFPPQLIYKFNKEDFLEWIIYIFHKNDIFSLVIKVNTRFWG